MLRDRPGRSAPCRALPAVGVALLAAAAGPDAAAAAPSARADELVGDWRPADRAVTVRVERTGKVYTGTVVASADASHRGIVILRGFTFDSAQRSYRGDVFAARRGAFVPAVVRMEEGACFRLIAGTGLLSREVVWCRP